MLMQSKESITVKREEYRLLSCLLLFVPVLFSFSRHLSPLNVNAWKNLLTSPKKRFHQQRKGKNGRKIYGEMFHDQNDKSRRVLDVYLYLICTFDESSSNRNIVQCCLSQLALRIIIINITI